MILLAVALQAAAPATAPPARAPADPLAALHGIVVENIRHCPQQVPGEAVVCARDRGFAESYRLPKLDPRFDHAADPPAEALADPAAPANPCRAMGEIGTSGCTFRDYEAWLAWQRAQEAKARKGR